MYVCCKVCLYYIILTLVYILEFNSLSKQIMHCKKCILHKYRKNAVPGNGDIHADIVMIGEAPGKYEDISGMPFTGKAGDILLLALKLNDINKTSVYITNIVKCRPPNNRIPKKLEIETCKNYLQTELSLIKPKIICIMGNTAYKTLLGGKNILKNRGNVVISDKNLYFLTIHPASVIYNKKLFVFLKNDIQKMISIVLNLT